MELKSYFTYLILIAGSTYMIRVLPFILAKKKIENPFVRSFLYYIPFAVLTAMTIPAVFTATGSVISALAGVAVAVVLAWKNKSMTVVAVSACIIVYLVNLIVL